MPLPETDRKTCHDCSSRHQCLIGRQSDAARAPWAAMVEERRFRKGDVLQHQGETAGAVAVIKVGTALLQRAGADQVARPVAIAGCGQALGTSAVLGTPEDLTWVALMEGRLCEVPAAALLRAGGGGTEFLQSLLREEVQARARLADWSGLLRRRGVTAQLASALLQLSQLQRSTLVRLPTHTVLASLLATTRETVARSLTQLALHGAVVRHDRWHCAIVRGPLMALLEGRAVKAPAAALPVTAATLAVPTLAPVAAAPLRRRVARREASIPVARRPARAAAAPKAPSAQAVQA
ncbi:Crp/Fnr family transcriptional regulator [Acidovorax sp. NCPPB 4044]|uniref:Crp/Fnr family transcriptional regulator n=1 Tax=Acidovorax sp. NCPPB 4044 TaxID=2940490 RepID=UPI002304A715|nr:Crp/Fnr family transcriptional regulator [Acidovorax sp. NCPPB 4044]MDA8522240.1 Crp/Fnr family transcriptional regulator [Acidovorax sp. NCPPB 4044]